MIRRRAVALAAFLAVAGMSEAAAQFPPPPGQAAPAQQDSAFPPPPGQGGGGAFPPPPGRSSAFPPPGGQASPFPSVGGQSVSAPAQGSPFPSPGASAGAPGGDCNSFMPLREAAEKGANAIRTAGERKAGREEVCPLFKRFALAEDKMIKFLETHKTACGIPPQVIKQAKANHVKTVTVRNNVCSAAPVAAAPTLSDALSGPILPDESAAKKRGAGTFNTLTGNPFGPR
jgi:hypothetical protein